MIDLGPEVLSAAKAIGLVDGTGALSPAWFENPLAGIEKLLSSPDQRKAFLDLLDQLFPPETPVGAASNDKWHPLLGSQPSGNLYLTVANGASPLKLGIAGEVHGTTSPLPTSLRCHLPIVMAGSTGISAIAGTADGPFKLDLGTELNWSKANGQSIELRAIRASVQLTPLAPSPTSLHIVLEGLSIDGRPAADTALDPTNLNSQALQLVIGLIREELHQLTGASGEAATVVQHLLPVFGLSDGFPPFPFGTIASDAAALKNWLAGIASAGKFAEWVGHLGALLGGAAAIQGSGTHDDPWRVRILQIDANSQLEFALAQATTAQSGTPAVEIGLRATYSPGGADPAARLQASATFVSIPLQGLDATSVLPSVAISVVAPGRTAATLVNTANISVGSIQAGAQWNGSTVAPMLELDEVSFTFSGVKSHYDRIDLTHADSVVAAASDVILAAIQGVLGTTGAGHSLAVLAGFAKPVGDAAWPHKVDVPTLLSNPARAIAAVHRAALLDVTHSWSFLLAEIASLAGVTDPVTGSGKVEDPWRVVLESDVVSIELAAWNAQQSGKAADPQQLRLGLRLSIDNAPWSVSWLAELLAFDLPANGSGNIALLGAQHAQLSLAPIPTVPATAGISIGADSLSLKMDWSPGSAMQIRAVITNLTVTSGITTKIPSLVFPPAAGFDFSNPLPTLGISADVLQTLFRALLSRGSYSWAGTPGLTLSALLGLNANLPGMQTDWPVLTGNFFADVFGALRDWLSRLVTAVSADGSPFFPIVLAWLQAFLTNARPELDAPAPDAVRGSGSYEDPWAIQILDGVDLLTWLEPDGPPSIWAKAIATLIGTHQEYADLLAWGETFGTLVPTAQEALAKQDRRRLLGALNVLEQWFIISDGFVPSDSQIPTGGTWTAGTPIHSAHTQQPSDPAAITQINAKIAALNPGAKVVLLIGPGFLDHTIWDNLPATATVKPNFNLRLTGVDPSAVDLRGVTEAADFYTCDLAENGLVGVTAHIGRVVARISELRPSVPVTLVAHSTAGLAARAFAAANPTAVRGIITIGTPHSGSPLLPLRNADVATALRTINELTPTLPDGPLRDAVSALTIALDGLLPAEGPDKLPTPRLFPLDAFTASGTTHTGGVPALAIGGALNTSLFAQLKMALGDLATATATASKPAPTHLGFGARARIDFGSDGDIETEVSLRCDAARLALKPSAGEPSRPVRAFAIEIALARPGDWLVGSAASNIRLRWAELGVTVTPTTTQPFLRLHGAAFLSQSLGLIDETHAQSQAVLGAMFHSLADLGASAGPALTGIMGALGALGITTADAHGGVGISIDAWKALTTDARTYLKPRLQSAFGSGLAGFSGGAGQQFVRTISNTPFQVYIDADAIGIRTATTFAFSDLAGADLDARLSLTSFQPSLDLGFSAGSVKLKYEQSTRELVLTASPWIDSLSLIPRPSASEIATALKHAIPRILLSSAASALAEAVLGPNTNVGPLVVLLDNPGALLTSTSGLGDGKCLSAARINDFLSVIASATGLVADPELQLPAGLQLTASGADPIEITLSTVSPIAGVVDVQVAARIDCARHVTPAGTLGLNLTLPGTWGALKVTFGVDPSGVSLVLAPQTDPPIPPIQLLPTFSGLGALLGSAQALLPGALDALVDAIGPSTLRDDTLAVAQAFDLYDPAGKFTAHSAQLRALTDGNWSNSVSAAVRTAATAALAKVLGHVVGTVTVAGNTVKIAVGGEFNVALGWDSGPTISLHTTALKAADGALTSDIDLGFISGQLAASVSLGLHLESSIGIAVVPALKVAYQGTAFSVKLLPLGLANESTLSFNIAPTPGIQSSGDVAGNLAHDWLVPIATDLLVAAARPHFALTLWNSGPTLQKFLTGVGVISSTGALATPLPALDTLARNLLTALAAEAEVSIAGVKLKFVSDTTGLGVNLRGSHDLPLGSVDLKLRLENTDLPTATPGVTIYVFRNTGTLQFNPKLSVAGLGIELAGQDGGPLVNNSAFRLESAGGTIYFNLDDGLTNLGGALDCRGLGLPLGLLGGSHDGGNPVASSLLEGARSPSDDQNPVNPGVSVQVSYVNGSFGIQLGAPSPPLWIGVHRSFGPIYIEQIGLSWTNDHADLLVDGSVKVASLTVQAYELGLNIPFKQVLSPEHWSLDLQGLALGFQSGTVSIAGGLAKNPGPPIEYDGLLSADIAGRGFTVVGGYARPVDTQGNYTSLFIFVSLPIPLGGPPFFFVTGLGGGAGYNRRLTPPNDLNQIPNFFLISAIDDSSLANNPMGALISMGRAVPPHRGGYWLAAGLRFNSFVVVNSIAVVYVALDRGFEVGILGISRMQLPAQGIELVSIELALKARYSSAEQTLSIQAQLTDNSWLFSRDCQLTGGFAFFIWFAQGHFVLTIGGYHPSFQKPPEFPVVPRLGFHWQVLDNVQIKGESYFAITSSAFMCGGRLEASARFGGIRAWFTVHVDILIQWDPFHYDFRGGIEVGVSLTIEICFFGACADVSITISRGADIHIFGPPFHADLTFDAYITSITLSFGDDPPQVPDALPWATFRDKYLISGNPENTWVSARVLSGLLPTEPPGAQPVPGSQSQPWKMIPEFAFLTESRMPVSGYAVMAIARDPQGATFPVTMKLKTDTKSYDIAPMQKLKVASGHTVTFTPAVTHPNQFLVEEISDLLPEATWRWYDPAHLPAAANRINAITGLRITGVAVLQGKSALIPISTLVDDNPQFARPLPFVSVLVSVGALQTAGLAAEVVASLASGVGSDKATTVATTVLTGDGFFSDARRSVGLPADGLPLLAARALVNERSSSPLLTPLSTGLSMKNVGLTKPPIFGKPATAGPVVLQQVRLKAVLQSRAIPTVSTPPATRTTVTKVSTANVARMLAPRPKIVAGAKLQTVAALNVTAATSISSAARTLKNPDLGALSGKAHSDNFSAAAKSILGGGVTVPAGTTHVWEVPQESFTFTFTGNAAVRIVYLDRAGNPLQDTENIVNGQFTSKVVPGTEMATVTCLGSVPAEQLKLAGGFGAVSSVVAPAGANPAVGWQSGSMLTQVGPNTLLARGAVLILAKAHVPVLNSQKTSVGMMPVSAAVAQQSGLETRLPKTIGVVMIILDREDPTAAAAGDLAIACDNATLAVPPVLGVGGNRSALLYDVISTDAPADHITIAVGSKTGWSLAGVAGLHGKAVEWAAQLHGGVPPHLVPDGPLTSGGDVSVRMVNIAGGNP